MSAALGFPTYLPVCTGPLGLLQLGGVGVPWGWVGAPVWTWGDAP